MPVFTYRGTNRSGGNVSGELSATSKAELQNLLRRQQITPTKMSEKGKEFNLPSFGSGVNAKELAIFTRQFSVMIDAGLPLVQCLEICQPAGKQDLPKVLAGTRGSAEAAAHSAMRDYSFRLLRQHGRGRRSRRWLDTILQRLSSASKRTSSCSVPLSPRWCTRRRLDGGGRRYHLALWKVVPIRHFVRRTWCRFALPTKIVIALSNLIIFGLLALVAFIFGLKVWYGTPQGRYAIDATIRLLMHAKLRWRVTRTLEL
jgi:type IV pilus assembly protein PilC